MKYSPFPAAPNPINKVESYFVSPVILAILRVIFFLYAFAVLIVQIVLNYPYAVIFYGFLTILSYYAVILYFLISSGLSLYYVIKKRVPWEKRPWANRFITGLYIALMIDTLLVTCIYWSMLFSGDRISTPLRSWLNISVHALQTVFMLIEFALCKHQWNWKYPPVVAIVLFIYLAWALIVYVGFGFLVYPFLDYHNGKLFGSAIGIVIAVFVVICVIMYILHRIRNWLGLKVSKE